MPLQGDGLPSQHFDISRRGESKRCPFTVEAEETHLPTEWLSGNNRDGASGKRLM